MEKMGGKKQKQKKGKKKKKKEKKRKTTGKTLETQPLYVFFTFKRH